MEKIEHGEDGGINKMETRTNFPINNGPFFVFTIGPGANYLSSLVCKTSCFFRKIQITEYNI